MTAETLGNIVVVLILLSPFIVPILVFWMKNRNLHKRINKLNSDFDLYKDDTEHLRQYQHIEDAKAEAQSIVRDQKEAIETKKKKLKELQIKAEETLSQAYDSAASLKSEAQKEAKEIAGQAWEAKSKAEQYEATAQAMRNIIKGYGDEYLVPSESLLDSLADEYDHKAAGEDLKAVRTKIKEMVKGNKAANCDYAEKNRRQTAIEFVLDAFNGKVDSIMSKVKHDNYGKLKQQIRDSYRIVNHNGKPFKDARILDPYLAIMLDQLKLAVTVQEIKRQDQEEQKRIRDEMREEERARREFEKARKQAEKEEKMLEKAMKEAQAQLAIAAEEEKGKFEAQLLDLTAKLKEAEEKGQRAMSMAEQTKRGHVYVISNVGSFGEDVYKIGLTRRLEPLDRVKELGDASVPFSFDVHAMIHSDDAPKLEKELHKQFSANQVNKVNPRKEFFNVSLADIKQKIEEKGLNCHWTMKSEAVEYRESLQLSARQNSSNVEQKGQGETLEVA